MTTLATVSAQVLGLIGQISDLKNRKVDKSGDTMSGDLRLPGTGDNRAASRQYVLDLLKSSTPSVVTVKGAKGDTGDPGPQGDQGIPGQDGQDGLSQISTATDVLLTSLSNGDILSYNATALSWENIPAPTVTLGGLTDVTLTSPSNGQYLKYDTTTNKWINATLPTGGGGGSSALATDTDVSFSTLNDHDILAYSTATSKWINVPLQTVNNTAADATHDGYLRYQDWIIFKAKEASLSTPASNGQLLASTAAGVRYWVDPSPSTLATQGDVFLTSPANQDVLAYNATTHKWYNTSLLAGSLGTTTVVPGDYVFTNLTVQSDGRLTQATSAPPADATHNGYLKYQDWITFNNKEASLNAPTSTNQFLTSTTGGTRSWAKPTISNAGDVTLTSLAQNQILAYDTTTSKWLNTSVDSLANGPTGVTAGDYTFPGLSISADGRITLAASGHVADGTHDGYLSSGDWTLFHGKEGGLGNPAALKYVLTSDLTGTRSWSSPALNWNSDVTLGTLSNGDVLSYDSTAGKWVNNSVVSGSLTNTGVPAATYTFPVLAVHADGRIYAASNGPAADATHDGYLSSASWSTFTAKEPGLGVPASNGMFLMSTTAGVRTWANVPMTLAADNDVQFSSLTTGDVLSYNATLGKWVNNPTLSGGLSNSGVNPGTYLFGTFTVQADGRVTSAVACPPAGPGQNGYLAGVDWVTFNAKEPSLGNPPGNGQYLASNTSGSRYWTALPTPSLSALTDVAITFIQPGDYISWDAGAAKWKNVPAPSGGGGGGGGGLTPVTVLPAASNTTRANLYFLEQPGGAINYQSMIIAEPNIRGYWPCDDAVGSTTLVDVVGTSNLTIVGSLILGQESAITTPTGNTSILGVPNAGRAQISNYNNTFSPATALSMDCWFYPQNNPGYFNYLCGINGSHAFYMSQIAGTNTVSGRIQTTTGDYVANFTVVPGRWNHVAVVWDGAFLRVYVNGVLQNKVTATGSYIGTADAFGISGVDGIAMGGGGIDEVAFYTAALSAEQVQNHYFAGVSDPAPDDALFVGIEKNNGSFVLEQVVTTASQPRAYEVELTAHQGLLMVGPDAYDRAMPTDPNHQGRIVKFEITDIDVRLKTPGSTDTTIRIERSTNPDVFTLANVINTTDITIPAGNYRPTVLPTINNPIIYSHDLIRFNLITVGVNADALYVRVTAQRIS